MADLLNPKNWINPQTGKRYEFFDREGNGYPDMHEWAQQLEKDNYKRVAETYLLGNRIWVSTVWLGLDHSFLPDAPPLIFETMVFSALTSAGADLDMDRYTTEAQALEGHKAMVKKWRNPLTFIAWALGEYKQNVQLFLRESKNKFIPTKNL